jgi:tRNA pseudouridine55 synthase
MVTEEGLRIVLAEFTGRILQTPPQFSAVHVQGRRAYKLARRGETVDLEPRPVEIFSLKLTAFQPPEFELDVECGSGTYLRSIGRDIGQRLGCGAIMKSLRRMAVGPFHIDQAMPVDRLTVDSMREALRPATELASSFGQRQLTRDEAKAIRCGQSVAVKSIVAPDRLQFNGANADSRVALLDADGQLLGVGEIDLVNDRIQPRIVFPEDAT